MMWPRARTFRAYVLYEVPFPTHPHPLQQRPGRFVSAVRDGSDPVEPQVVEGVIQQARDGFRSESFPLVLPCERESDLGQVGFLPVNLHCAVPDEISRLLRFDGELEPLARHAGSRRAYLADVSPRFILVERVPGLVFGYVGIVAVGTKGARSESSKCLRIRRSDSIRVNAASPIRCPHARFGPALRFRSLDNDSDAGGDLGARTEAEFAEYLRDVVGGGTFRGR
jgi:hypothetical protein